MPALFHFKSTLNRLFNNCIKSCWYKISSSWKMKEGEGGQIEPHAEKKFPQKACLKTLKVQLCKL